MKVNQKLSTNNHYKMIGGIPKVEIDARINNFKQFICQSLRSIYLAVKASVVKLKINFNPITLTCIMFIIGISSLFLTQNSQGMEVRRNLELNSVKIEYTNYRDSLYNEIDSYIKPIVLNHNLNIYKIIDLCINKEYDIKFLLTQAQLESHFGTRGEAVKTKSMFNIIWCNFNDKNESIEPYIDLMKRRYLINKNINDLLNNFIDINGNRYAEDVNYEKMLKIIYTNIVLNTKINEYNHKLIKIQNKISILSENKI